MNKFIIKNEFVFPEWVYWLFILCMCLGGLIISTHAQSLQTQVDMLSARLDQVRLDHPDTTIVIHHWEKQP